MEALPAKLQAMLWNSPSTTIFTVGLLSYLTVTRPSTQKCRLMCELGQCAASPWGLERLRKRSRCSILVTTESKISTRDCSCPIRCRDAHRPTSVAGHLSSFQELVFVVKRYIFARRPPYDTKLKPENYIISDK